MRLLTPVSAAERAVDQRRGAVERGVARQLVIECIRVGVGDAAVGRVGADIVTVTRLLPLCPI